VVVAHREASDAASIGAHGAAFDRRRDLNIVALALRNRLGIGIAAVGQDTNPPFGQTGENSPGRDKLCLGGGLDADRACHCCSCVDRVRIDRGRTRLVRVPVADGQRTSSVTSGGQLAVYRQEVRPFTDTLVALLKNFAAQAIITRNGYRAQGSVRRPRPSAVAADHERNRYGRRRCLGGQCSGLAASATSTTTSALGGIREIEGIPLGGG
jgi:hypothetical protein